VRRVGRPPGVGAGRAGRRRQHDVARAPAAPVVHLGLPGSLAGAGELAVVAGVVAVGGRGRREEDGAPLEAVGGPGEVVVLRGGGVAGAPRVVQAHGVRLLGGGRGRGQGDRGQGLAPVRDGELSVHRPLLRELRHCGGRSACRHISLATEEAVLALGRLACRAAAPAICGYGQRGILLFLSGVEFGSLEDHRLFTTRQLVLLLRRITMCPSDIVERYY